MKRVRWALIALIFAAFFAATLDAETTVNAYVDRNEISEGESVEYTIEIKGDVNKVPAIGLPSLPEWQVYSQSTATSYSWVNGRSESSKQFHFTLAPTRTGKILIPSLTVPLEGKSYATPQITVTVNPVAMNPQTRNVPQSPSRSRAQTSQSRRLSADDLMLRSTVDHDTVYVNQQVTLSMKFYYRVRLLSTPEPKIPQRTGFWAEDLGQWRSGEESYSGKDYGMFELKTALFPAAPGVQTIGASEMNVVVDDGASMDPFSIFNQQFPSFGGRRLTLKSDPIKVVTLPLPDVGKPADFGGAVGQYQMAATVDKTKIEVNEPLTMHIKITGIGNIKGISIPGIPELPDFRTYLAGDDEKIEKVNYQVGGTKTFDQSFIPKRAGSYLLPGLKFSFFDPKARTYKTLTTDQIQIEVSPSKDRYASQVQNFQTNRIDLTAKDIRYLKTNLGELRSRRSTPISASPWFLIVMYIAPVLGYAAWSRVSATKSGYSAMSDFGGCAKHESSLRVACRRPRACWTPAAPIRSTLRSITRSLTTSLTVTISPRSV